MASQNVEDWPIRIRGFLLSIHKGLKRSLIDFGKMCCRVVVGIVSKTKKCLSAAEPAKKMVRKGSALLLLRLPGWGLARPGWACAACVNVLLLFLGWFQNL